MGNIIVIAIVVLLMALAIRYMVRNRNKGMDVSSGWKSRFGFFLKKWFLLPDSCSDLFPIRSKLCVGNGKKGDFGRIRRRQISQSMGKESGGSSFFHDFFFSRMTYP